MSLSGAQKWIHVEIIFLFCAFCHLTISQWNTSRSTHVTLIYSQSLSVTTWCGWIIIHPGKHFDRFSLWPFILAIINTAEINITLHHSVHIGGFLFLFFLQDKVPDLGLLMRWNMFCFQLPCCFSICLSHFIFSQSTYERTPFTTSLPVIYVIWDSFLITTFSQKASHSRRQPKYYPNLAVTLWILLHRYNIWGFLNDL